MKITRVVGVPIDSVGAQGEAAPPFGTETMPSALRRAGLSSGLADHGVADDGDMEVRVVGSGRDGDTGLVGWPSASQMTETVRREVASLVRQGERPLLLGGCCALVPGAVAGLRDALGVVGLVNVDGHLDLYDEINSPTGEIADVPVAALLDVGVGALQPFLGQRPVISSRHVALVGFRDADEALTKNSVMPNSIDIDGVWDSVLVGNDPGKAAGAVVSHVRVPYWLHLDLDVLDEQIFPATDYLMPGGLDFDQLTRLLRPIVHSEHFAGMSVACLNPEKDPGDQGAQQVTAMLLDVLANN